MSKLEQLAWIFGGLLLLVFIELQFLPIWRLVPSMNPNNPPVEYQIEWQGAEGAKLMHEVCYVCHSNETVYPIYMRIAPMSWVAAQHVNEGREALNFSEQPPQFISAGMLVEHIESDEMPPALYRSVHPEANFTPEQKEALIATIYDTLGGQHLHDSTDAEHHHDHS
jgi:hypothetical protein